MQVALHDLQSSLKGKERKMKAQTVASIHKQQKAEILSKYIKGTFKRQKKKKKEAAHLYISAAKALELCATDDKRVHKHIRPAVMPTAPTILYTPENHSAPKSIRHIKSGQKVAKRKNRKELMCTCFHGQTTLIASE